MSKVKTIEIGEDITARRNANDNWEIKHPGTDGKMLRWYSTGMGGSERDLRRHIKAERLEDMVALGKRDLLKDKMLAQFQTGSSKAAKLPDLREPWIEWMRRDGESPATIKQYDTYYKLWMRTMELENVAVSKIGFDHLFPFVNPDSDIKKTTREARLHMSRSLFKYATAQGYCSGNPSTLVKVNMDMLTHAQKERKPIDAYSLKSVQKLIAYVDSEIKYINKLFKDEQSDPRIRKPESRLAWMHFWRFAIIASYEVGLRLGDICDLQWASLTSVKGQMIVWTGKREKRIALPLNQFSPWLRDAIKKIPCDDLGYCFPDIHQVHLSARSTVSVYFGKICGEAKVKPRTFHALRHTAIRRMQAELHGEGLSYEEVLKRIGKIVAHSNTSTTEGYLG